MTDEDARTALAALIAERRDDYAGLSRLLGRNPAYIQQYVRRGTPRRLSDTDRAKLAAYFRVPESGNSVFVPPGELAAIATQPGLDRTEWMRILQVDLDPRRPAITVMARQIDRRDPGERIPLTGASLPESTLPAGHLPVLLCVRSSGRRSFAVLLTFTHRILSRQAHHRRRLVGFLLVTRMMQTNKQQTQG